MIGDRFPAKTKIFLLRNASRLALWPSQPLPNEWPTHEADHSLHLVPRIRMCGATPPPLQPYHTFCPWSSGRAAEYSVLSYSYELVPLCCTPFNVLRSDGGRNKTVCQQRTGFNAFSSLIGQRFNTTKLQTQNSQINFTVNNILTHSS
jgi:hypothetical protein